VLLLASAFVYGSLGLALSSFVKTTVGATLLTYISAAALFAVTLTLSLGGASNAFLSTPTPGRACLVALNPIGAMVGATITEGYYGLRLPAWLTSLLMNGLLGTLFTLTAIHRLGLPRTDRSPLLRGLTALFCLLSTLLLSGSFIGNNLLGRGWSDGDPPTIVGTSLCGIGALLAMIFATGNGSKGHFLALKRGEAPSGFTYTLLMVGVGCLILTLGLISIGYGGYLGPARIWPPALVVLASTFGLGGVALGVSALTRNRWVSMGIVGALAIVLFVVPVVEYTTGGPQALDKALFLSAPAAVSDAVNSGGGFRTSTDLVSRTFWEVTVAFYGLLGVAGLVTRLRRKQLDERVRVG
jgi:hypothetical protein